MGCKGGKKLALEKEGKVGNLEGAKRAHPQAGWGPVGAQLSDEPGSDFRGDSACTPLS